MDPAQLRTLVTFVFPMLFGTTLIAFSVLTCRIRRHNQQLINLELRMGAVEVGPRLAPPAPVPLPVYQPMPPAPSAPPVADPGPVILTIPAYQGGQTQGPRYTGYI